MVDDHNSMVHLHLYNAHHQIEGWLAWGFTSFLSATHSCHAQGELYVTPSRASSGLLVRLVRFALFVSGDFLQTST